MYLFMNIFLTENWNIWNIICLLLYYIFSIYELTLYFFFSTWRDKHVYFITFNIINIVNDGVRREISFTIYRNFWQNVLQKVQVCYSPLLKFEWFQDVFWWCHHCSGLVFLSEHGQQLAVHSLPHLVLEELAICSLVCRHLGLLVVIECPLLCPAHVPGLQQDLATHIILRHTMNHHLVVL